MKKILIGFVMFLLAASAWAYIPPANLTVSGQGLSITGGTQAVNGTGTNITISKVASADYSTSAGSAGTASTAGYASTAGAASTALTAGVAAYAVLTGTASSTAHATTADYASLTAISSSCSGNASTVTNGVYTSNTYSNPAWLSSVSYAVLSGTATSAASATSASYSTLSGTATNAAYATLTATASTCSGNAANITGTLAVANGGTALTSYATGDVIYASGATTLSKLKIGGAGQGLVSRGGIPSWEALSGSGTVTQINTGTGLTGGPITTTGTISIDTTVVCTGGVVIHAYSHVLTGAEAASGNYFFTIASINRAKIVSLTGSLYHVGTGYVYPYADTGTWGTAAWDVKLNSDTSIRTDFYPAVTAAGDTIAVTIISTP